MDSSCSHTQGGEDGNLLGSSKSVSDREEKKSRLFFEALFPDAAAPKMIISSYKTVARRDTGDSMSV